MRNSREAGLIPLGAAVAALCAAPAFAQRNLAAKPAPKAAAGTADKVLYDVWYTVTVNKTQHYEYYNERAELRKGKLFVSNHAWKQEEDFQNEEELGEYAEPGDEVRPLFYNFHSNYRSTELTIDGTVENGHILAIRVRKGSSEQPIVKKQIASGTIFSESFPAWLGFRLTTLSQASWTQFLAIDESNTDLQFRTLQGRVKLDAPDDYAIRYKTVKITLDYDGLKSSWWVDKRGVPEKMEYPATGTLITRVTKDKAQKFFGE